MRASDEPRESDGRPSADQMLEQVRRQAGAGARGRLRVYLGMAPGVGKTFAMLNEGRRRQERGTHVVVGFAETYNRPKTVEAMASLEVVPRKRIEYRGVVVEEMDTDAVIRRRPQVALVDELAHTNAPGSKHEKRWQDVHELLDHGITVISTVNIQHVESLADIVETITGAPVRERVPDSVIDQADEIEVVDMSPHALRQRIRHGNVYPKERAEQALHSFFREGNLNALRELALRKVATTVEEDLEEYMRGEHIDAAWPAGDRVLVYVDSSPDAQRVLRRAARLATHLQTDLIAVAAEPAANREDTEPSGLEQNIRYAEDLGADVVRSPSAAVVKELIRVAHEKNAGTIVVATPLRRGFFGLKSDSVARKLIDLAEGVDVYIVGTDARH